MMRNGVLGLAVALSLGACAGTRETRFSHTPETEVSVKGAAKRAPQANYRVSPEESKRTGSGGSAR